MVTTLAVLLALGAQTGPAAARRHGESLWTDLFGDHRSKPRRAARLSSVPMPKLRPAELSASVPLPKPRPADAPAEKPAVAKQTPAEPEKPAEQAASPPPPSACRLALTDAIAIAPSIPDIKGPGQCGGGDLVRLEAVVLPDNRRVSVKPAAVLRCTMAAAIADWIRTDIVPLAEGAGSVISDLDNFDSFDCRGRNGIAGAHLSEHGRANALDVRAVRLANGQSISFTDRTVSRELRESVLHSACARFPTVLGPGSDGYHEDHIHLDLIERHNNYRICQWNVWDPMPQIAPLLPAGRPEEAPPRQVAAKPDADQSEAAKPDAAKSGATKSDAAKPDAVKSDAVKSNAAEPDAGAAKPSTNKPSTKMPATKKRRENRRS